MEELKKLPPPSPVEEPPSRGNQNRGRRKQQLQQTPVGFSISSLKFLLKNIFLDHQKEESKPD